MDASFLYTETPTGHMHVTGVIIADATTMKGGYNFNTIKDMVKDQLPTWTAWWTLCGLCSEHFGKSRNSLKHAGASMASMLDAEQEYWVSTKALLVLMVHWPRFRKNMSDKSKSSVVGISLLKKVCPRDALLALELGVVDPGCLGSCVQQERYAGKSRCVRMAWQTGARPI